MPRTIIFTDLDGTLLDAKTYSFEQALPALRLARQKYVPIVFVSSKTRAELEKLRHLLENRHPFIAENGGGIFIPEGYFPFRVDGEATDGYQVISLGTPYPEIRRRFIALRERLGIAVRGFGDMTPDQVAELTGLSREEAVRAMQRDFCEPFVFPGPPDERFLLGIEAEGLRWTQGRFFHIMGQHHKGRAAEVLRKLFEQRDGSVVTMGIGDSLNDLPLLLAVDRPVLIRREDGAYDARINIRGIQRTESIGPAGWNEAVMGFLKNE